MLDKIVFNPGGNNAMTHLSRLSKIIFLFASFSYCLFPVKAYAYVDPGTGSYVIQIVIAALLGILFTIKSFWNKLKSFFVNLFSKHKSDITK